jgi:hypothetical protein
MQDGQTETQDEAQGHQVDCRLRERREGQVDYQRDVLGGTTCHLRTLLLLNLFFYEVEDSLSKSPYLAL